MPGTGRKGFKAELDSLRERMSAQGFRHDEIAAEIGRRYRVRPREAYRLAWGWSLEKAAARFNEHACRQEADAEGRASLTGSRPSEFEHWPRTARKPSVYVLVMLAEIYQTDVLCLLDFADHESLPQPDLLVLTRRPRAGTLSGELAELAEPARTAQVVARDDEEQTAPGNPAGEVRTGTVGGFSLSLPYVPGRLVIEVSGPAGDSGQLSGGVAEPAVTGGRLTLVRDGARTGGTWMEGAGG
jgi:hypothetical protein